MVLKPTHVPPHTGPRVGGRNCATTAKITRPGTSPHFQHFQHAPVPGAVVGMEESSTAVFCVAYASDPEDAARSGA